MFEGLAFLVNANMSVVISRQGGLLVRADTREDHALIDEEHIKPLVMCGRGDEPVVPVNTSTVATDSQLEQWVARGVGHAS
jgi:hypothetical protein